MLTNANNAIGQRVKAFRLNRRLSQDELADGICSRQTISLLENGQHFPSVNFMQQIATKLGIPLHEIMNDQENELETNLQIDIIKVYVETKDYTHAKQLSERLLQQEELLEYQQRELIVCRAECSLRTGKADEAVSDLSELQQKLEKQQADVDKHFMATVYDKLGTAYYMMSNMMFAYSYYLQAHQICRLFPEVDFLCAKVNYNLGNICLDLGYYSEAVIYLTDAQRYFENTSDLKRLAAALFASGLAYHANKDRERADNCLKQSLELYKSLNITDMAQRIKQQYAYYVLAPEEPEQASQKLLDCAKEYNLSGDKIREAYTYSDLASLYMQQEQLEEAGKYLDIALSLFDDEMAFTNFRYANIYRTNAIYLQKINEFEKSAEYAFKSADIFEKMGNERESAKSLRIAVQSSKIVRSK